MHNLTQPNDKNGSDGLNPTDVLILLIFSTKLNLFYSCETAALLTTLKIEAERLKVLWTHQGITTFEMLTPYDYKKFEFEDFECLK